MAAVFVTMSAISAVAAAPTGAAPTTECMNGMAMNQSGECVPVSDPGTIPSQQGTGAPAAECAVGMTVNKSGECLPISSPGTAPSVQVAGGVDPIDPESPDSAMNICQYLLDEGQIEGYCPVDQTTLSAD